jgi:hypothetical protein
MKSFFHEFVTPIGISISQNAGLEWMVEKEMMGGRLSVEWANKLYFGDMDRIDHVLLEKG